MPPPVSRLCGFAGDVMRGSRDLLTTVPVLLVIMNQCALAAGRNDNDSARPRCAGHHGPVRAPAVL
eukprot:8156950-Pyramimonas_sp.AAC.1